MQKQYFTAKTFRLACCLCLGVWCCFFLPLTSEAGVVHGETSHVNHKNSGADNAASSKANAASSKANGASMQVGGSEALGEVAYESMVVAKKGSEMLALYNTLSDPVDKESLDNLARDCFQKVHGNLYKKVLVNWYLPGQSKGDKPWAVSNFADGQEVIEILDEEMVKKFPSVKRWQQPGHDPLPR